MSRFGACRTQAGTPSAQRLPWFRCDLLPGACASKRWECTVVLIEPMALAQRVGGDGDPGAVLVEPFDERGDNAALLGRRR